MSASLGRALDQIYRAQEQVYLATVIQSAAQSDDSTLRRWLQSDKDEMRFGAAYVIGEKKLPMPHELISVLSDRNLNVQQAARRSLVLLANRAQEKPKELRSTTYWRVRELEHLGPKRTTSRKTVKEAVEKWHDWWEKNDPDLGKLRSSPKDKPAPDSKSRKP